MSALLGQLVKLFMIMAIPLSVLYPWIGVLAYYLFAVWAPSFIWRHTFAGSRFVLFVSLGTMAGFGLKLIMGKINFSVLKERQNVLLLLLWFFVLCSFFFAPYGNETVNKAGRSNFGSNPKRLLSVFNNIYLFYFISVLIVENRKHLHCFLILFILIILHNVYWANDQYLSGMMFQPRLNGPGPGGTYTDENTYAMLFVAGTPTLYFMGNYYKSRIIKLGLWLAIPLAWHAVFLTGSMGGFLGLGVTTMFIAFRSKKKSLIIAIPIVLMVAFITQGGSYLKNKSEASQEGDSETAHQRTRAWKVGAEMMIDYPFTGVGIGNFLGAYPDYHDSSPHIAHNTFFQFAGENGLFAGLLYLGIVFNVFLLHLKQNRLPQKEKDPFLTAARESISGGVMGFFCCAMFLNLGTYEIFYFLLILNSLQNRLTYEHLGKIRKQKHMISKGTVS